MGTFNAFYVPAATMDDTRMTEIRTRLPIAEIQIGPEYQGFQLSDRASRVPESDLLELSRRTREVIWLSFQSTVDAFQFHHWRAGEFLRSLVYGCFEEERTWERVEGHAEPWEREVFFDPAELERSLEWAESLEEKRELERIWREAELLPGRTEPSLDARECARAVAEFYRLPGWDLEATQ